MYDSDKVKKLRQLVAEKINTTRMAILMYLAARGESYFKELYEDLGLTPGNAWSHLEKLNKDGLVKIKRELGQGRPKVVVTLTSKGLKEVDKLIELFQVLLEMRNLPSRAGEGTKSSDGNQP